MTKWIKDVDTGELFPVKDDFEYEIPEHLKTAECNHIDYEKTTRTTIDELQSQLTAAQNEIAVIQQEREVPLPSDSGICNDIDLTKHYDLSNIVILIVVTAFVIVFALFAYKLILTNDININTSYSTEQQSDKYQEQEQEDTEQSQSENQSENEDILLSLFSDFLPLVRPLLTIVVCISGVRLGVHILKNSY